MRVRVLKDARAANWFNKIGVAYLAYMHDDPKANLYAAHAVLQYLTPGAPFHIPSEGLETTPIELSHVHVAPQHRRKGLAGRVVRNCLRYADSKGWIIVLRAEPYSVKRSGLDLAGLVDWYTSFGFTSYYEGEGCEYMVRHPETRKV